MSKLRVVVVDDERGAREFLKSLLREFADVEIAGEAADGIEAAEIIKRLRPDLVLLDLNMPQVSGLDVVRSLPKASMPLIAFVTAHDEFAVKAFEVNAVDYLLKPVEKSRLALTLSRAADRLENAESRASASEGMRTALAEIDTREAAKTLERIPVKLRDEIVLVPTHEIASFVADGELLHLTTAANKKYSINYRLRDLERRLEAGKFVRLSRGAIANLSMIASISPMPGGTYLVSLKNGQEIASSRPQSKVLRQELLKL